MYVDRWMLKEPVVCRCHRHCFFMFIDNSLFTDGICFRCRLFILIIVLLLFITSLAPYFSFGSWILYKHHYFLFIPFKSWFYTIAHKFFTIENKWILNATRENNSRKNCTNLFTKNYVDEQRTTKCTQTHAQSARVSNTLAGITHWMTTTLLCRLSINICANVYGKFPSQIGPCEL